MPGGEQCNKHGICYWCCCYSNTVALLELVLNYSWLGGKWWENKITVGVWCLSQ